MFVFLDSLFNFNVIIKVYSSILGEELRMTKKGVNCVVAKIGGESGILRDLLGEEVFGAAWVTIHASGTWEFPPSSSSILKLYPLAPQTP